MANQQIHLNYCAQCKHIDKETVYNFRWLHFSFCCLMCLKRFSGKLASKCDLCDKHLDFNRIHVRDDVQFNDKTFRFICDQCFDSRIPFAVHCYRCTKVCYKGFGAKNVTVSGLISKFICSIECEKEVHQMLICCECGIRKKCETILNDNKNDAICSSSMCLANYKLERCIEIGKCDKCSTKFANSVKHEHVIIDSGIRKSFCCAQCMNAHVREDTKIVVCCNCQHRQQYYNSIRRSCDDRFFCSIYCAIAGETGIEQLVQNDERSYLAISNLKFTNYDSEFELNDSFEDCISSDESITATDRVSENTYATTVDESFKRTRKIEIVKEEAISPQYEITSDFIARLTAAPILQPSNYSSRCYHCQCDIRHAQFIVQWEFLEFCSITCYEGFILMNNYDCTLCTADYDAYHHVVSTRIVGNRLYLFCSERCSKLFANLNIFCKFCRNISYPANDLNGFCQLECQRRFDQLYGTPKIEEKLCSQCQTNKTIDLTLLLGGEQFNFCSYSCYFYRTFLCGLIPEQCTICQMYFGRNQSDLSYTLRHSHKLHVFCSQSCLSHFIHKYQHLQMCSLCLRQKSNFNMIKLTVNWTTIQVNYCSVQCLQIVEQSIKLEQAFRKFDDQIKT